MKRVFGADRKCQYFYDKYGNRTETFYNDDEISDDTDEDTSRPETKAHHVVDLDSKDNDDLGGMFQIDEEETETKEENTDIVDRIESFLLEKFDYADVFDLKEIADTFEDLETTTISQDMIEDRVKKWLRGKAAVSNPARNNNGYVAKRLIENINFFVHSGGFEAVLKRIGCSSDDDDDKDDSYRIPIDELKRLVYMLYWMRHLYTDMFASSYFPRLKDVCVKRLTSLSDEELRSFDMSKIESLLEKLSVLLPMATRNTRSDDDDDDDDDVHNDVETLFLDLAFRLLTCPIFAKRMQGAENLDLWIRRTTRQSANDHDDSEDSDFEIDTTTTTSTRKSRYSSTNMNGTTKPSAKEMWLSEYMTKRKVAEIMLSSSVHVELMKKSGPILRFLGRCGKLTDNHVEMLWSNVDSGERDRSDAASNLLEDVTNGLPVQMLDTLYDKIKEHKMTTERHVELVRRFCSGTFLLKKKT